MAIEFLADADKIEGYLPEPLRPKDNRCCLYFIEWQYASENGREYVDPIESQYSESILLMNAEYKGETVAYCPFIWVNQDKALLRGLIQGWPKQLGETYISKRFQLESKASPKDLLCSTLSVYGKRYMEGQIQLKGTSEMAPTPSFAGATLIRYFPDLQKGRHQQPLVNELVKLTSRDVKMSDIRCGEATLDFKLSAEHELNDFAPLAVGMGYAFEIALTVDDLMPLERL